MLNMQFCSKLEAYCYALLFLSNLTSNAKNNLIVRKIKANLKISIVNHEQNFNEICKLLNQLIENEILNPVEREQLVLIIQLIRNDNYDQQSQEDRFRNPLSRRLESELALAILQSPTRSMMHAIEAVSKQIIKSILFIETEGSEKEKEILNFFPTILSVTNQILE